MADRSPGATDRDLVAAHLGGDQAAFAAIYDRYADALHDTAAAMLSDRADAEDMTHDVFVIAAGQLGRLRDPDRLRAWLFAILRNEVYRRSKRRRRARPTDFDQVAVDMSAPPDPHADAADVERAELATFVREAAAGLAERDQLILELTARQGLSGTDLAAALGVTQQQCHVLLHRMRTRVQRSLAALTVARNGRKDCPDLQALLGNWNGTFDPRIRKRIAAHVDDCDICEVTSRKFAAVPLMSAAPALAAPPQLRDRVLQSIGSGTPPADGGGSSRYDAAGFPAPAGATRLVAIVATVATVLLVLLGGAWLAMAGGEPSSVVLVAGSSPASTGGGAAPPTDPAAVVPTSSSTTSTPATSTPATSTPATTTPATTTSTTSTTTTTTSTSTPTTAPPTPGTLVVSARELDLGSSATQASLSLANTGEMPLDWSIDGDAVPLLWSSTSGALAPGDTVEVFVSIDRGPLAEGSIARDLTIASSALGAAPLTVLATVEHTPIVSMVSAPSFLRCRPPAGLVVVEVVDESAITDVVLSWSGPGSSGAIPMSPVRTLWEGRLTPARVSGDWTWVARATDARGNVGTASAPFIVSGC